MLSSLCTSCGCFTCAVRIVAWLCAFYLKISTVLWNFQHHEKLTTDWDWTCSITTNEHFNEPWNGKLSARDILTHQTYMPATKTHNIAANKQANAKCLASSGTTAPMRCRQSDAPHRWILSGKLRTDRHATNAVVFPRINITPTQCMHETQLKRESFQLMSLEFGIFRHTRARDTCSHAH